MKMNKIFACLLALSSMAVYAVEPVSPKLTKGMEVVYDDFTNSTTYSFKDCALSVVCAGDSVSLVLELSVVQWDAPFNLERIIILVDGETTQIDKDDDFSSVDKPQRQMLQGASGRFGSASYRGAEYVTRSLFIDAWRTDAPDRLPLMRSIASRPTKIRFVGSRENVDIELSSKRQKKMAAMVALFDALSNR